MPKVGKITIRTPERHYTYDLYYSMKEGGFYAKGFPQHIIDYMRNAQEKNNRTPKINVAATEKELQNQLTKALHGYHEFTMVKRKVIKIKFGVSDGLTTMEEPGGGRWRSSKPTEAFEGLDRDKLSGVGHVEYGMGFTYEVGYMIKTDVEKFHDIITKDIDGEDIKEDFRPYGSRVDKQDFIMDYTDEKIAFLEEVKEALGKVAAKLYKVLTDEKTMQGYIDNHQKLLTENA